MSKDKKLTKEQLDWIDRQLKGGLGASMVQKFIQEQGGLSPQSIPYQIPPQLSPEELLRKQEALAHLEDLMKEFDKKYMEELFEEGLKSGALPNTLNQYYRYEFK